MSCKRVWQTLTSLVNSFLHSCCTATEGGSYLSWPSPGCVHAISTQQMKVNQLLNHQSQLGVLDTLGFLCMDSCFLDGWSWRCLISVAACLKSAICFCYPTHVLKSHCSWIAFSFHLKVLRCYPASSLTCDVHGSRLAFHVCKEKQNSFYPFWTYWTPPLPFLGSVLSLSIQSASRECSWRWLRCLVCYGWVCSTFMKYSF